MDRIESFKLIKNQKRKVITCGVIADLVAAGDGFCIYSIVKDTIEKFNQDQLAFGIIGFTACAIGTAAGIILGKRMINELSFCRALKRHLEQYPNSHINVTPEEYKKNESVYGIQYTKAKHALRRQRAEDYKEEALSSLGILR